MRWCVADRHCRTGLHHASLVEHHHLVAEVADDRHVVGNEQVAEASFVLQVSEQVEDLGLDRQIEGADGFVEHDEFGRGHDRPRDADALQLAAGERARAAVAPLSGSIATASSTVVDAGLDLGPVVTPWARSGSARLQATGYDGLSELRWVLVHRLQSRCQCPPLGAARDW